MAGQQENDKSNDLIYVGGFVLLVYILLLTFFGEYVAGFHLMVRGWWADLGAVLWPWGKFQTIALKIDTYAPREWMATSGAIDRVSKDLRWIMFPPLALAFAFYAWRVWKKNPSKGLRRIHSRQSLIRSELGLWPWLAPVDKLDLVAMPIDEGDWAVAKTPVDFAKRYRLLNGRELHALRAEKFFASQLGPLWEGPEKLPRHARALFACFVAQACRDKDGARDGLRTLAETMAKNKPDYGFVEPLLQKHMSDPRLAPIFERHAYAVTVLCAMLEMARQNGVLPPAYFIWMRPLNRSLWYALNGMGRRTPFCENAGVHAHYLAEKVMGRRMELPYVKQAMLALQRALREYKFD